MRGVEPSLAVVQGVVSLLERGGGVIAKLQIWRGGGREQCKERACNLYGSVLPQYMNGEGRDEGQSF